MTFLRRTGVTIAILLVAAGLFFRATACVKVDDPSLLPAFDAAQALPPPPKPQTATPRRTARSSSSNQARAELCCFHRTHRHVESRCAPATAAHLRDEHPA